MRGTHEDLESLLSSGDANLRGEALEYAVYNPIATAALSRDPHIDLFGTRTPFFLNRQLELKQELDQQINTLPSELKAAGAAIAYSEFSDASPGLRAWISDQIPPNAINLFRWVLELYLDNTPYPE